MPYRARPVLRGGWWSNPPAYPNQVKVLRVARWWSEPFAPNGEGAELRRLASCPSVHIKMSGSVKWPGRCRKPCST